MEEFLGIILLSDASADARASNRDFAALGKALDPTTAFLTDIHPINPKATASNMAIR